jgi:hypothetical protein
VVDKFLDIKESGYEFGGIQCLDLSGTLTMIKGQVAFYQLPNLIAANSNSGQTITQELGHLDTDRVHRGRKNTEAGGKVQLFEPAEPVSDE